MNTTDEYALYNNDDILPKLVEMSRKKRTRLQFEEPVTKQQQQSQSLAQSVEMVQQQQPVTQNKFKRVELVPEDEDAKMMDDEIQYMGFERFWLLSWDGWDQLDTMSFVFKGCILRRNIGPFVAGADQKMDLELNYEQCRFTITDTEMEVDETAKQEASNTKEKRCFVGHFGAYAYI